MTGWDTRWDMGHWDGTGATGTCHWDVICGVGHEDLGEGQETPGWDRRQGSRLGHGTPGLDRSHWEGTHEGTGATEPALSPSYSLFPSGKPSPSHPLQGHTQAHAVPSWKTGIFPGRRVLIHNSPGLPSFREELLPSCGSGTFPGKTTAFPRKNPSGWSWGVLEPPRYGGFSPTQKVLGE